MKFGVAITGICAAFVFAAARPLTQIYSDDPQIIALAVFSIRFMAIGLVFDTISTQLQHYLQGIRNLKMLNALCIGDRLIIPVASAFVLGNLYGSKGVLASIGISKGILVVLLFMYICVRCKGLPKSWVDVMFLPEGFGGSESDNLYAEIRTLEDAVRQSKNAYDFCLEHGADRKKALYLSLCVEEMAVNIIENAREKERRTLRADFRLFVSGGRICFSLRDLTHQFDPTSFYELNHDENPEAHIGIRMVTRMAEEIRYFSAFSSNNLIIYMD